MEEKIKQKEDPKKKLAEISEGNRIRRRQNKIKNRYAYLSKVDVRGRFFSYEFAKAQATEAIRYFNELKHMPFLELKVAFESTLRNDVILQNNLCVKYNDFGELELDIKKLESLIIKERHAEDKQGDRDI